MSELDAKLPALHGDRKGKKRIVVGTHRRQMRGRIEFEWKSGRHATMSGLADFLGTTRAEVISVVKSRP